MEKIIKELKNYLNLIKLSFYFSSFFVFLLYLSFDLLFNFLIFNSSKSNNISHIMIITIVINILFSIIPIIIIIFFLYNIINSLWISKAKNIIISNILKEINLNFEKNSQVKYSIDYKKSNNLNPSSNLLSFLNDLLIFNNPVLYYKALNYINNGFVRLVPLSFRLEDEFIIRNENLHFEMIEVFLTNKYKRYKNYKKIETFFKGLAISTKLKNIKKINNPILIYSNLLFTNPKEIKFLKTKSFNINESKNDIINLLYNEIKLTNVFYNAYTLEIIDISELNFEITNLLHNIYCLYNIEDKETFFHLKLIFQKTIEKFFIINNYTKSFIIFYKDIIYLFLNYEDNIISNKNLFYVPSFLKANSKNLNPLIFNIKNQLEKILELFS